MQHTQYSWAEEQIPQLQVMVKRAKLEHHSPARDQQPDPTPWMQMAQKAIPESLWEKQRGVRRWSVQKVSPQGQESLYEKQDPRAQKASVSHGKNRHSH